MFSFTDNPIQAIPVVLAASIFYCFIRRAYHKKKYGEDFKDYRKKIRLNEAIRLLFVTWSIELICCTLVPTGFFYRIWTQFYDDMRFFRPSPKWFNLVLLGELNTIKHILSESVQQGMLRSLIYDYILNVLMFVPLGFGLPFLQKRTNVFRVVLIGLLCTLFIEFVQGFMYRDSTIDDVVCNTLGALLGYMIYLMVKKLFPKFITKANVDFDNKQ